MCQWVNAKQLIFDTVVTWWILYIVNRMWRCVLYELFYYLFVRFLTALSPCSAASMLYCSAERRLLIGWHMGFPSWPVRRLLSSHWWKLGGQLEQGMLGRAWRVTDTMCMCMIHCVGCWRSAVDTAALCWSVYLLTYLLTYRQVTWHETYVGRTEAVLTETDRQSVSRGIDQLRRGTMARVRVKRSEVKVWVMMRIELGHCCSIHTVLTVWCVDYM